jgi:serine phosphatase RsbU (regulator of sigma subunit)
MEGLAGFPRDGEAPPTEGAGSALSTFAAAALGLLEGAQTDRVLAALLQAVALGTGAELVVARLARDDGVLIAHAVHSTSVALIAELQGTGSTAADVPEHGLELEDAAGDPAAPPDVRKTAARAGLPIVLLLPVVVSGEILAALELYRSGLPFGAQERGLAGAAAAHLGLALRIERARERGENGRTELSDGQLELLGEALAAGADEQESAEQILRVATEATGAVGGTLWRLDADGAPSLLSSHGFGGAAPDLVAAAESVRRSLEGSEPERSRVGSWDLYTLALGEPATAALRLAFDVEGAAEPGVERLGPFGAGAALALRRSRHAAEVEQALERSQTLVAVISQAIAQLSLAHTLETALERIAELSSSRHVAVYLSEGGRLTAPVSRGLGGLHTELAERLLELALGPYRSRGFLFVEDLRSDPRLAGLEDVVSASGVRRALFVPLLVHDQAIGALAVFQRRPRPYREGEESLLLALSSQLAVAVQNARLHERTKELSAILERTLESERRAARQVRGLYAISQSFTESLSLDATLDAVARAMVELLDADVAVIRMPDPRTEALTARAVHIADQRVEDVVAGLVALPQPLSAPLARRLVRSKRAVQLRPGTAAPEDAHRVLDPFLRQGATAAVLPLATPGEVLATLTVVSFDPDRPLEPPDIEAAMAVGSQAALAIDNARLYQQQKDFAETMQRSLLPRELPRVPGLEIGHVYQSSARVDVGGDLYDFVVLEDGRLAVVVGDVLGKGISAAADMAMAKYVFRVLARGDANPAGLLRSANDVACDELAEGKFMTLLYVLVDVGMREIASASAGHPPARTVDTRGRVTPLGATGLPLGIDPGQPYAEERAQLEPGAVVVLYTDGVVEARRGRELYGVERLDRLLAEGRDLPAQQLAAEILADCRSFAGGELGDDCAIVCLKLAR